MMTPDEWIARLAPFDLWNERHLLAVFTLFGLPRDYLDVGSGTGAMVNVARRLGVDAYGVDQLARPDHWLIRADLREPLDLERQFDLVTCLETAEHLPPNRSAVLADTLARHLRPGAMLIFSAAGPGQNGEEHENCQPASFWRAKFWERGLQWKEERTIKLKLAWQLVPSPLNWLAANVEVFERMAAKEVYPAEGYKD